MKFKITVMILFLVINTYSQQNMNAKSSSQASINTETSTSAELPTPTSMILPKSSFDQSFGNSILAPTQGTEMAFGLTQTHLKMESKFDSGKGTSKGNMSIGSLTIAHAFNESFFIGANLNYGQSNSYSQWTSSSGSKYISNSTSNSNGTSDPTLTLGSRLNISKTTAFLISLSAKIKSGDSEYKYTSQVDSNDSNSESNLKSGGNSLTPLIGIYTQAPSGLLLGGSISYSILSERTSKDTDSNGIISYTKSTGRNVQKASMFMETQSKSISLGGSVDYSKLESGISKSTYSSKTYEYENDALSITTLSGFANITLNKNFSLIPSLTYGKFGEGTSSSDEKDIYSANILAKTRF